MNFVNQNKQFVSDIDKFLQAYDATHSKSASQRYAIAKYQRIYRLRDHVVTATEATKQLPIWEDF